MYHRRPHENVACVWKNCIKARSYELGIPLCLAHAQIAAEAFAKLQRTDEEKAAERERKDQENRAATAAKIEAGIRPANTDIIPGYVYYIRIGDVIKIGYTRHVSVRMRAYPPNAELLAVEPGTPKVERKRHDHFHAYLEQGREWFRPSEELLAWIAKLREEHGDPASMAYKYTRPGGPPVVARPRTTRGTPVR